MSHVYESCMQPSLNIDLWTAEVPSGCVKQVVKEDFTWDILLTTNSLKYAMINKQMKKLIVLQIFVYL